jgi:hypothetical protein
MSMHAASAGVETIRCRISPPGADLLAWADVRVLLAIAVSEQLQSKAVKAVPSPSLPRFIRVESRPQRKSGGVLPEHGSSPGQPARLGSSQGPYPGPLKAASGPGWVALLRVRGPPLPGWQSSHPPRATTVTTCMQVPLLVWAADAGVACLPSQTGCHCLGSPEKTRRSEHTR